MNLKDFLQGKFPTYKEVQDHMTSIGIGAHATQILPISNHWILLFLMKAYFQYMIRHTQ